MTTELQDTRRHTTRQHSVRPRTAAKPTYPSTPSPDTLHAPVFDLEGGALGLLGVVETGEVEDDLVVADDDLCGTGVLGGEGVLEDGLVVVGLRRDIEGERVRARGGGEVREEGDGV